MCTKVNGRKFQSCRLPSLSTFCPLDRWIRLGEWVSSSSFLFSIALRPWLLSRLESLLLTSDIKEFICHIICQKSEVFRLLTPNPDTLVYWELYFTVEITCTHCIGNAAPWLTDNRGMLGRGGLCLTGSTYMRHFDNIVTSTTGCDPITQEAKIKSQQLQSSSFLLFLQ
jgi:hypothetical protein